MLGEHKRLFQKRLKKKYYLKRLTGNKFMNVCVKKKVLCVFIILCVLILYYIVLLYNCFILYICILLLFRKVSDK